MSFRIDRAWSRCPSTEAKDPTTSQCSSSLWCQPFHRRRRPATNHAFGGLPLTIAAGSTISLTTAEGAEPHEIIVMRVADSDTRSIEELQADGAAPPELEGQNLWIDSLPDATNSSVRLGDGTLGPGRYLYFCSINQGPTGESAQIYLAGGEPPAGGTPHFLLGMAGGSRSCKSSLVATAGVWYHSREGTGGACP